MDETSVQVWPKPLRTWMGEDRVEVKMNLKRHSNVTIFGAIGRPLKAPIFMVAKKTNIQNKKNPYSRAKPLLILDNHRAH